MKVKIQPWQLDQRQSMSLDHKIEMSKRRIRAWHEHYGDVCVSFSGGMDSTVLLHLVRIMYPDTPAIFVHTGLEFPEIVQHVKRTENVQIVRPEKTFKQVIEQYGYPVVSKRQAQYIGEVQRSRGTTNTKILRMTGIKTDGSRTSMGRISRKWLYLTNAPFKISDRCCHWLKKKPIHHIVEEMNLYPFVGTRAGESDQRTQAYYVYGCNAFDMKHPRSTPLAFWTEDDIWDYVERFNVPYSEIYDMGYRSTGCMFCAFGAHLEDEPNRFQQMQKTHPKIWKYCMEELGMREVLSFVGVKWHL